MRACKAHWGIVSVLLQYGAASLGNLPPDFLRVRSKSHFPRSKVQGNFNFTVAKVYKSRQRRNVFRMFGCSHLTVGPECFCKVFQALGSVDKVRFFSIAYCQMCVRLTTSPPSRAECHEIWEPKPPGTLWTTLGLLRDSYTVARCLSRKGKGKVHPRPGHEGPEGSVDVELYSFFNLGARWGWVVNATPLEKTRYPL